MNPSESEKLIFFDTETTGLVPGEIAQLSYLVTDQNLKLQKACNYYFSVASMPWGASRVHGLTHQKLLHLSEGRSFGDHSGELFEEFHGHRLVGHNVAFDMAFLRSEFRRRELKFTSRKRFCTMSHFKPICKLPGRYEEYKNPRLSELLNYLEISPERVADFADSHFENFHGGFHDGRFDAAAVYLVYKKGVEKGFIKSGRKAALVHPNQMSLLF